MWVFGPKALCCINAYLKAGAGGGLFNYSLFGFVGVWPAGFERPRHCWGAVS
jgi:hypothetical protein